MSKQLSLSERIVIERMLSSDETFAAIGDSLSRSASTISREVKHYRMVYRSRSSSQGDNDCTKYSSCLRNNICRDYISHVCYGLRCKSCPDGIICVQTCKDYESAHCSLLDKPPYVCSGCKLEKTCKKDHAYYLASRANSLHAKALKNGHSGIRLSSEQLSELGELIQPLIARGQSLSHICAAHKESIPVSERTLYTYIGNGVFDIRNIDLPKKVAYRKRHEHKVLTRFEYKYREGRTIADFNAYLEANPTLPVVEMDTVKGKRGSLQVFLTMIFRETSFMLIFPMKDGTQESVIAVFDMLNDRLGTVTFRKLFPVILTDNGVEFKDPESLEQTPNGSQRTRVFFCDPQASWQKPQVENNHRLIRRIVPKGVSFDTISSEDVRLITRHINSVLRDQYEGKCPFDLMVTKEQKKLLESLRLTPVPPDEVLLKPDLIKH